MFWCMLNIMIMLRMRIVEKNKSSYIKVERHLKNYYHMEGSHSGLVRTLGKRVRCYSLREFESLTLRQLEKCKFEESVSSHRWRDSARI